jgi:hypothetical protein
VRYFVGTEKVRTLTGKNGNGVQWPTGEWHAINVNTGHPVCGTKDRLIHTQKQDFEQTMIAPRCED